MKTVIMEEMSWPQVKKAMESGYKTVIIPVGSIEQHGPHLPLGTDYLRGYPVSREIAQRIGKTLVGPTVRPALSEHHMRFPGTVTLRPETFRMVMEDYVDCYVRHGFKNIIIINIHGGNAKALESFAKENADKYPGVKIVYPPMGNVLNRSSEEENVPPNISGKHSGHMETSTILAFYPQFVDMSAAEQGFTDEFTEELQQKMHNEGIGSVTPNGILGDARGAHAARGIRDNMRWADWYCEYVLERIKTD